MAHFSLVIIGSGSGNLVLPEDGDQGPVALIESGAFGGLCINRGCVPSKILIQTATLTDDLALPDGRPGAAFPVVRKGKAAPHH